MKKIICFVFITGWAFSSHAQPAYPSGRLLSFGFHGAYSTNTINGNPIYLATHGGFNIGVNAQYKFNQFFSAYTEFNYEQKGAEGTISYYNTNGDFLLSYNKTQYLHYASVPLMARVFLGNEKIKAFAGAGAYYGFLVEAWVNPNDAGVSHDVTSDFKKNDFGICGGAGVQWHFNKQYFLSAEWRMNYGLMDISSSSSNQKNLNNIFQLGIAYKIATKK